MCTSKHSGGGNDLSKATSIFDPKTLQKWEGYIRAKKGASLDTLRDFLREEQEELSPGNSSTNPTQLSTDSSSNSIAYATAIKAAVDLIAKKAQALQPSTGLPPLVHNLVPELLPKVNQQLSQTSAENPFRHQQNASTITSLPNEATEQRARSTGAIPKRPLGKSASRSPSIERPSNQLDRFSYCLLCPNKDTSHRAFKCERLLCLGLDDRIDLLKRQKLCLLCLCGYHSNWECTMGRCKHCFDFPHNSVICPQSEAKRARSRRN